MRVFWEYFFSRKRETILKWAIEYYGNNKKVLREQRKTIWKLSEEENNMKREYGRNRYHDMSEEKKHRLKEYQKKYCEAKKKIV